MIDSGIPPYADPSPIIYKGNVKLDGWIIYKDRYVDDMTAHFHVADQSLKNLPPHLSHRDFILTVYNEDDTKTIPATEQIVEKLKNEGEPVSILVDRLEVHMEGSPSLNLIDY